MAVKQCPVCDHDDLDYTQYDGFRVMKCNKCKGYLLAKRHLDNIERMHKKSQSLLQEELSVEFTGSTDGKIRCPICYKKMDKREFKRTTLSIHADACEACGLVWLDGGELALLQLAYMTTGKYVDAEENKFRMQEVNASLARKAEYEKNLAQLPDEETDDLTEFFREIINDFHKDS